MKYTAQMGGPLGPSGQAHSFALIGGVSMLSSPPKHPIRPLDPPLSSTPSDPRSLAPSSRSPARPLAPANSLRGRFRAEAAGATRRRRPDEPGEAAPVRGAHGRPQASELLQNVAVQVSYKVFIRAVFVCPECIIHIPLQTPPPPALNMHTHTQTHTWTCNIFLVRSPQIRLLVCRLLNVY